MFNTTAETNYDGVSIPNLLPDKYEDVRLIKVEGGESTKKTGEKGKRILTFLFQTKDGQQHQHTEWEPEASDAKVQDKTANLVKRVGHIMSKFLPKDRLVVNVPDFAGYQTWVVNTMNSVAYKEVPVDILVTGNVYNGKATSAFTGYPPFIAKRGEGLNFDNNATLANKKYYDFKAGQSAPKPDTEGGSGYSSGGTATDAVQADF